MKCINLKCKIWWVLTCEKIDQGDRHLGQDRNFLVQSCSFLLSIPHTEAAGFWLGALCVVLLVLELPVNESCRPTRSLSFLRLRGSCVLSMRQWPDTHAGCVPLHGRGVMCPFCCGGILALVLVFSSWGHMCPEAPVCDLGGHVASLWGVPWGRVQGFRGGLFLLPPACVHGLCLFRYLYAWGLHVVSTWLFRVLLDFLTSLLSSDRS